MSGSPGTTGEPGAALNGRMAVVVAANVQQVAQPCDGTACQASTLGGPDFLGAALEGADFVKVGNVIRHLRAHLCLIQPCTRQGQMVHVMCSAREYRHLPGDVLTGLCAAAVRLLHDFQPHVC